MYKLASDQLVSVVNITVITNAIVIAVYRIRLLVSYIRHIGYSYESY